MRILHAYKIYRPDIEGGIPAVISTLAADRDARHSVVTARRSGLARRIVVDDVPVDAVGSFGNLFSTPVAPFYIPAFRRHAAASDIVIHHAPFPLNDAAAISVLPACVALIVYWHADVLGYPLLRTAISPLTRRMLARADKIVVSGRPMIDGSDLLAPLSDKCEIHPYGIDLAYWQTLDATEQQNAHDRKRARRRHVLAVGRLVGYKGFDVLVKAMKNVNGSATIVGEGPLLGELQQLANDLGVADRIVFAGRIARSEIKTLLHSADVLAFPSVTAAEAFGISQIEAMAAGLPIVNTQLPTTVPLVARHDLEALTVAPGDAQALSVALSRILDDPALAQRLGASARARASSEFDAAVFRTRMRHVYEAAVRERQNRLKPAPTTVG